jgi:hypothetical protein
MEVVVAVVDGDDDEEEGNDIADTDGLAIEETGRPAPTVRLTVDRSPAPLERMSASDIDRTTVAPVDTLLACSRNSSCFWILTSSKGQLRAAMKAPEVKPPKVDTAIVDPSVSWFMNG